MTRLKPATVLIRWLRVSTGSYGLFSKKPSDPTTGVRRKRRTPLAAKSEYIYVRICTHEVTPYMIKRSSKDDRAI
jgi:hypothetical protein